MGWKGLAGGGCSGSVCGVERGMGDAMTQWDGDAAGGMSQCHWVGLGWVGQSTWGPVQVLVEGGLVPGGFTGCACAEIQCGSLI